MCSSEWHETVIVRSNWRIGRDEY